MKTKNAMPTAVLPLQKAEKQVVSLALEALDLLGVLGYSDKAFTGKAVSTGFPPLSLRAMMFVCRRPSE